MTPKKATKKQPWQDDPVGSTAARKKAKRPSNNPGGAPPGTESLSLSTKAGQGRVFTGRLRLHGELTYRLHLPRPLAERIERAIQHSSINAGFAALVQYALDSLDRDRLDLLVNADAPKA